MSTELGLIRRLKQRVNTLYQESFRIKGDLQQSLNVTRAITAATPSVGDMIARGSGGLVRVPAGRTMSSPVWRNGEVINNLDGGIVHFRWPMADQSRPVTVLGAGSGYGAYFSGSGLGSRGFCTGTTAAGRTTLVPYYLTMSAYKNFSASVTLATQTPFTETENYILYFGVQPSSISSMASTANGLWLMAQFGGNEGKWVIKKRVSSVDTDTNTAVAIPAYSSSVASWQKLRIVVSVWAATATVYIGGTQVASFSIADWLAVSTSTQALVLGIEKTAGITSMHVLGAEMEFIGEAVYAPNHGL